MVRSSDAIEPGLSITRAIRASSLSPAGALRGVRVTARPMAEEGAGTGT